MFGRPSYFILCCLFIGTTLAHGHIGSPDIFVQATAGPYPLLVTIQPPTVIPGVANLSVRAQTDAIRSLRAVPLPMNGPGAKFAPVPDELRRSSEDPQLFIGTLWMMAPGSWQVRFTANGLSGMGVTAVPIPSAALRTKTMQGGLGALLFVLMSFLVLGAAAIVGAAVRESKLTLEEQPSWLQIRKGRNAAVVAFFLTVLFVALGGRWWKAEATSYGEKVYKPLQMRADRQGTDLLLRLHEPGWLQAKVSGDFRDSLPIVRTSDDLVLDHQHLMHLYVVREPALDVIFHLHPKRSGPELFSLQLPSMPAGHYRLYADVTHASGFPETLVSGVALSEALAGRALSGDDGFGLATPVDHADVAQTSFTLPDGYRMEWTSKPPVIQSRSPQLFTFRLLDRSGHAPHDMGLYMGMLGHAAFMKADGSVFAHIHPEGSVSMAALGQAQASVLGQGSSRVDPSEQGAMSMPMPMKMPSMETETGVAAQIPNSVSFPYGLPKAGRYRVFVQMQHGNTVETAAFDLQAN